MIEGQANDQIASGLEHGVATDEAANLNENKVVKSSTNTSDWASDRQIGYLNLI